MVWMYTWRWKSDRFNPILITKSLINQEFRPIFGHNTRETIDTIQGDGKEPFLVQPSPLSSLTDITIAVSIPSGISMYHTQHKHVTLPQDNVFSLTSPLLSGRSAPTSYMFVCVGVCVIPLGSLLYHCVGCTSWSICEIPVWVVSPRLVSVGILYVYVSYQWMVGIR